MNKADIRRFVLEHEINQTLPYRSLRKLLRILRVQRPATWVLGRQNVRSRSLLEIDITYQCNLACAGCDRSCPQAPSRDRMGVEQVALMLEESIRSRTIWKMIKLLGGEPTLNPDLPAMIELIAGYRRDYNTDLKLVVVSNGYGERTRAVLQSLPSWVVIDNTDKTREKPKFEPFNLAPRDRWYMAAADYTNGCGITTWCGLGLTPWGYYHCAVAGAIDRVFGFDLGRKKLPDPGDDMLDQFVVFCSLCGHFLYGDPTDEEMLSPRWEAAYRRYRSRVPALTRYQDPDKTS